MKSDARELWWAAGAIAAITAIYTAHGHKLRFCEVWPWL